MCLGTFFILLLVLSIFANLSRICKFFLFSEFSDCNVDSYTGDKRRRHFDVGPSSPLLGVVQYACHFPCVGIAVGVDAELSAVACLSGCIAHAVAVGVLVEEQGALTAVWRRVPVEDGWLVVVHGWLFSSWNFRKVSFTTSAAWVHSSIVLKTFFIFNLLWSVSSLCHVSTFMLNMPSKK